MEFLTREAFEKIVLTNYSKESGVHDEIADRWTYHSRVMDLLKEAEVSSPNKVLEVGTMGTQLVHGSHTLDYEENWEFEGNEPTYRHDARQHPWPIPDKRYDWLVAMRVFHHLYPFQRECFLEAQRVARNVVIVVPTKAPKKAATDRGITPLQLFHWNGWTPPALWERVPYFGFLYVWSDSTPPMDRGSFLSRAGTEAAKRAIKRAIGRS